jgi:ATP-dependent Clp endopeptidase proteolytic subunit ClpP
MKKEWYKITNQTGGVPEIYVYGILSPFPDDDCVSYTDFQAAFRQLEPYNSACNIRINCIGGSILEGLAMYDMIRASAMRVTTICEGVAASMGGVLFEAGDERVMYPNSRLMIHRAQGAIAGDADAIRAYADQVESCEDSIKAILKERAGLDDAGIDALMQTNVDLWITADDAVNKYHLADKIILATKAINLTSQNLAGKKPEEVYNLFYNQLTQNFDMNKLKASLVVLLAMNGVKLSLEDSDEKFYDEVEKILKAKDDSIANIAKVNSEAIVNQAVAAGLLKDEEKEPFVNVGIKSPAMLITMIAKLTPAAPPAPGAAGGTTIVNINPNLKTGAAEVVEGAEDRTKWTYMDWAKKDPTALATMETAEPEKFNKLVAAVRVNAQAKGWI